MSSNKQQLDDNLKNFPVAVKYFAILLIGIAKMLGLQTEG